MSTSFAPLFEPLRIGSRTVPNRVAMAPMTRGFVDGDGVVPEDSIGYYARRAAGGAGLILTEGIAVNDDGALATYAPRLHTPAALNIWTRIVAEVHAAGGLIVAQLWHGGLLRGTQGPTDDKGRRLGPSAVYPVVSPEDDSETVHAEGEAMTAEDMARTIADCVGFSLRAQQAGFDGVEIHGAHGYLFDQFFWDRVNRRTDDYGGDIAGRTRFTAETVAAIRAATAPDFIIGLRFSQWKNPAEHYPVRPLRNPDELGQFLRPLVAAGVDFFDVSARRYWEPAFESSDKSLAEWTQELSGKPTILIGSVTVTSPLNTGDVGEESAITDNLSDVAALIGEGRVAMVGVGRAMISNPDWANRVKATGLADLKPYDRADLDTLS